MSERAALKDYEREHEREREHGTELAAGSRHVAASQQTQPQPSGIVATAAQAAPRRCSCCIPAAAPCMARLLPRAGR